MKAIHPPVGASRLKERASPERTEPELEEELPSRLAVAIRRLRDDETALAAFLRDSVPAWQRVQARIALVRELDAPRAHALCDRSWGAGVAELAFPDAEPSIQPSPVGPFDAYRAIGVRELVRALLRTSLAKDVNLLHALFESLPSNVNDGAQWLLRQDDLPGLLPALSPRRSAVGHPAPLPAAVRASAAALAPVAETRAVALYRRAVAQQGGSPDDTGHAGSDHPAVERALARRGQGEPLLEELRRELEARFGQDLSRVRIHTDGLAAQAAKAVRARAFTVGEDIFFAEGAWAPTSRAGQKLLAHELQHVVQAQQGRAHGAGVSRPDDPLELEAEQSAEAMVTGAPAPAAPIVRATAPHAAQPRPRIFRQLDDKQKEQWDKDLGDAIVDGLKSAIAGWKGFREKPTSGDAMNQFLPSGPALKTKEFLEKNPDFEPHFKAQLGGDGLFYLNEMVTMGRLTAWGTLPEVLTGVVAKDAKPIYTMTTDTESIINSANKLHDTKVLALKITYQNALGWYWMRNIDESGLDWDIGIGFEKGQGDKKGKVKSPKLVPSQGTVTIHGEAKAKATIAYVGYTDLDAGIMTLVEGPSAKATVRGTGAKASTGGIIDVLGFGAPEPLRFDNYKADIDAKLVYPDEPGKAKTVGEGTKLSASLVKAGIHGFMGGDVEVATPEIAPTAVREERKWKFFLRGFETGSAQLPISAAELQKFVGDIKLLVSEKREQAEADAIALKQLGIQQEFSLDILCEGYASRRWLAAGNDDQMRIQKNFELSLFRAQNVATALEAGLGPGNKLTAVGRGPAVAEVHFKPSPGSDPNTPVVPADDQIVVEAEMAELIERKTKEAMADHPGMPEAQARALARREVEKRWGRNSNESGGGPSHQGSPRRVEVSILWSGYTIKWGVNQSPMPHDPNAPPTPPANLPPGDPGDHDLDGGLPPGGAS